MNNVDVAKQYLHAIASNVSGEVLRATAEGNRVALEVLWEGVLAIPLGTLSAGATMRAHAGMFLEFREGKIISQRNRDCFERF